MKLTINPMKKLLEKAELRVNVRFHPQGSDFAHDRKRAMSRAIVAGGEPAPEFVEAAEIEGLSALGLAELILSKPDAVMARENARRTAIVELRTATTNDELERILDKHGVERLLIPDFMALSNSQS